MARTLDGRECRSSGWGPAFLDPGSGYDLGEQGTACTHAIDRQAVCTSSQSVSTSLVPPHAPGCKAAVPVCKRTLVRPSQLLGSRRTHTA